MCVQGYIGLLSLPSPSPWFVGRFFFLSLYSPAMDVIAVRLRLRFDFRTPCSGRSPVDFSMLKGGRTSQEESFRLMKYALLSR
jgi:hypothetical protein